MRWVRNFKIWVKDVLTDIAIEHTEISSPIDRIECRCLICGHEWETRADEIRRRPKCPNCHKKQNYDSKILPLEKLYAKLSDYGSNITLSEVIDTKHYCKAICNICGKVWYPKVGDLLNGHGCPSCATLKTITINKKESIKPINPSKIRKYLTCEELTPIDEFEENVKCNLIKWLGDSFLVKNVNLSDDLKPFKYFCQNCGHEGETTLRVLGIHEKCPKCKQIEDEKERMREKLEKAISDLTKVHEEFEMVEFSGRSKKCIVKCKECGHVINSVYADILRSKGCPNCNQTKYTPNNRPKGRLWESYRITKQESFIEKAKEIHGDHFNYDKTYYDGKEVLCTITCNKHGDFQIRPSYHLKYKHGGCSHCHKEWTAKNAQRRTMTLDMWKERCTAKYNGKYDYSLITYDDWEGLWAQTELTIMCPVHGPFLSTPRRHLYDSACSKCSNHRKTSKNDFIERSVILHNDKYDYSLIPDDLKTLKCKVTIICPEHGEFTQMASDHVSGCGCPKCKQSHLERDVEGMLQNKEVEYVYQYRFDWLGKQSLDFYIPSANIGIECQGSQHFHDAKLFKNTVLNNQERDERKRQLCQENDVELIYYLNEKYNKYVKDLGIPYFNDIDSLCEYIQGKTA